MAKEKKYKIALADDHTILRSGLALIVNSFSDFEVIIEASDGVELIDKIEKAARKPDACIMDISMKGMDGYEATGKLKELWPEIAVLALSQFHNEFSVIKMLRMGAMGYLPKEANNDVLLEALYAMINKCIYYSDLVTEKTIAVAEDADLAKIQELDGTQRKFLWYCTTDLSYKQIAEEMKLSLRAVDYLRERLFEKLDINSRTGLAVFALQTGVKPLV